MQKNVYWKKTHLYNNYHEIHGKCSIENWYVKEYYYQHVNYIKMIYASNGSNL